MSSQSPNRSCCWHHYHICGDIAGGDGDGAVPDVLDLSSQTPKLDFLPESVFIGRDALTRLGRIAVLNLSRNSLQDLPELPLPVDLETTTEADRRRAAVERVFIASTVHRKGDLLFHCPNLQVNVTMMISTMIVCCGT